MSDVAHHDRRSRALADHHSMESRALYGAFYLLFVARAALKRLWPQPAKAARRESIFAEARTAASVMVASSFMGL